MNKIRYQGLTYDLYDSFSSKSKAIATGSDLLGVGYKVLVRYTIRVGKPQWGIFVAIQRKRRNPGLKWHGAQSSLAMDLYYAAKDKVTKEGFLGRHIAHVSSIAELRRKRRTKK